MIPSRSRTMHSQSPPLTLCGTVLKESVELDIFGVTSDAKMSFERHYRSASRSASQRLGILKSFRVFHDQRLLVLLGLEYYSEVWCSAADIHTLGYWTV